MTAEELAHSLTTYGAGLQAELALLHQLEALALAQRDASAANDLDRLTAVGDERARLMTALVRIEARPQPVREIIAANLSTVRHMPFFATRWCAIARPATWSPACSTPTASSSSSSRPPNKPAARPRRRSRPAAPPSPPTAASSRPPSRAPACSTAAADPRAVSRHGAPANPLARLAPREALRVASLPFLEQGAAERRIGRLVANHDFIKALLRYGSFDEYVLATRRREPARFRRCSTPGVSTRRRARRVRRCRWRSCPA